MREFLTTADHAEYWLQDRARKAANPLRRLVPENFSLARSLRNGLKKSVVSATVLGIPVMLMAHGIIANNNDTIALGMIITGAESIFIDDALGIKRYLTKRDNIHI